MAALGSLRTRTLAPVRNYVLRHSAAVRHDDEIGALRARLDRVEQVLDGLVTSVAALRPMADLPATVQEAVAALADRIEAVERSVPGHGDAVS